MKYPVIKSVLIVILFEVIPALIIAQSTVSPDQLFKNAREEAFENKNYDKAKDLAVQALDFFLRKSKLDERQEKNRKQKFQQIDYLGRIKYERCFIISDL